MTVVVASDDDDETDSIDGTLLDKDSDDREGEYQESRTTPFDNDESVGEGMNNENVFTERRSMFWSPKMW